MKIAITKKYPSHGKWRIPVLNNIVCIKDDEIKNPSNGGTEALYDIYNLFDDYRILSVFS